MPNINDIEFKTMNLSSQVNGARQMFALDELIGQNYILLYNGIYLEQTEYTIVNTTLITNFIPKINDRLIVDYVITENTTDEFIFINTINLKSKINGFRTQFELNKDITNRFYKLYYNGIAQEENVNYTIEDDDLDDKVLLTFDDPPQIGDSLFLNYIDAKTDNDECCSCSKILITMPLTIDQIIEQIKDYYPDGIVKVGKNGLNQVYLVSQTKGSGAFIQVSGKAAPPIFTGEKDTMSAIGEDVKKGEIDYSSLIEEVKGRMGSPLAPFELTDDQVKSGLRETLNLYYKWRNFKARQLTVRLTGNATDGYEIPPQVPNQKAIRDILFKPRIPFGIGMGGFENFAWSQMFLNQYNKTNILSSGFLADYYIFNMFSGDIDNILGLKPKWEILNDRIYITPKLPADTAVAIIYDGYLTLDEIMLDSFVLKYLTGYCRKLSGTIRAVFGGTLSSGETTLQMNGAEMTSMGQEEMDKALDEIKREALPPDMIWG